MYVFIVNPPPPFPDPRWHSAITCYINQIMKCTDKLFKWQGYYTQIPLYYSLEVDL